MYREFDLTYFDDVCESERDLVVGQDEDLVDTGAKRLPSVDVDLDDTVLHSSNKPAVRNLSFKSEAEDRECPDPR